MKLTSPSQDTVSHLAIFCALVCALDCAGLIPHGSSHPAKDHVEAAEVCTWAGDDAGECKRVRNGQWCPELAGWHTKDHRGATLAALALRGYEAREAARRSDCALKHYVLYLGDILRFQSANCTSFAGIVDSARKKMPPALKEGNPPELTKLTNAREVLASLVETGGPLALPHVGDAVTAWREEDGHCVDELPVITAPLWSYILETLLWYGALFLVIWALLHCCSCFGEDDHDKEIAERSMEVDSSMTSAVTKATRAWFGGTSTIPQNVKKVDVCLGWDTFGGREIDVDASIVAFDARGNEELTAVYFANTVAPGLKHSGDDLTGANADGEEAGDDETITITFDQLPAGTEQLIVCITIYNPPGATFKDITKAYCKIKDAASPKVFTRYDFGSSANTHTGLIMVRMLKQGPQWSIEKLGRFEEGKDFRELMPAMLQIRDTANGAKRRRLN